MSYLKTDVKAKATSNRSALNTTINTEIFDEFKVKCRESGVPMNVLIETFMNQYNQGQFCLKFGSNPKFKIYNEEDDVQDNFGEYTDEEE